MQTLSSLIFHQQKENMCCCHCHKEEEVMITSPKTWFPRIRRRSSSASSCSSSMYSSNSRRQSSDLSLVLEDKQVEDFEELYKLAVDEMAYAIESQGSIYYSGDLQTATEAVDRCLDRFRHLMQVLQTDRSHQLQQEWTDTLFELRSRLDSLPCPDRDS